MYKILFAVILALTSLASSAQNEVLLCPPTNGSVVLYNGEAVAKNKFDSKHYSNAYTQFKPIVFGEGYYRGKNFIQVVYIGDETAAMVFPEKVKIESLNGCQKAYAEYTYFRNALGKGDTKATRQGGVYFSWYPYYLYQRLNSRVDSIYYYVGESKKYKYGHPYQFSRPVFRAHKTNDSWDKVQCLNVPIKPLFKEDNYSSNIEIIPDGHHNSRNGMSLLEVFSAFISEDDYKSQCRNHYNADSIQALIDKYVGNEVYLINRWPLIDTSSDLRSNYWNLDSISFQRANSGLPTASFAYYAHMSDPNDATKSYVAYIPKNFSKDIELASEKRGREAAERKRIEDSERAAELETDREIQEMEDGYAKLYGRANARLIMDGEVRLGWSKKMCEESWGKPSEKTRSSRREIWWYGYGALYFEGNKLVLIHEKK